MRRMPLAAASAPSFCYRDSCTCHCRHQAPVLALIPVRNLHHNPRRRIQRRWSRPPMIPKITAKQSTPANASFTVKRIIRPNPYLAIVSPADYGNPSCRFTAQRWQSAPSRCLAPCTGYELAALESNQASPDSESGVLPDTPAAIEPPECAQCPVQVAGKHTLGTLCGNRYWLPLRRKRRGPRRQVRGCLQPHSSFLRGPVTLALVAVVAGSHCVLPCAPAAT